MKAKLVLCIQEAPSAEVVEPEVLQRYFAKFDEAFFTFCEKGKKNLSNRVLLRWCVMIWGKIFLEKMFHCSKITAQNLGKEL